MPIANSHSESPDFDSHRVAADNDIDEVPHLLHGSSVVTPIALSPQSLISAASTPSPHLSDVPPSSSGSNTDEEQGELDFDCLKQKQSTNDKIGLGQLPDQRTKMVTKKGVHFTLMVAGSAGVGKTSFINSLLCHELLDSSSKTRDGLYIQRYKLWEDDFELRLTTIETSGYGDNIDNEFNWIHVCNFIDEQFRSYLYQSEQPDRSGLVDTRVHCCLYFISPLVDTVTPLDIKTMQELSKRVNLIPIIGKGDTLSPAERYLFKDHIRQNLLFHQINVCNLIQDIEFMETLTTFVPFCIISSNEDIVKPDGSIVRGRRYPWGISEIEDPTHCDFSELRDLIMHKYMLDLIFSTEDHFENYREACLLERYKRAKERYPINDEGGDGMSEYVGYNKVSLETLEATLKEKDPVLEYKEGLAKKKFQEVVSIQEKVFKDWKKALVEQQNNLNEDIQEIHLKYVKLKEELEALNISDEELADFPPDMPHGHKSKDIISSYLNLPD